AVSIPVMAKARIGHFVEAQVLEALGVDFIDESEVLSPADYTHHINKWKFNVPFVCGATNLGEALRRVTEGAAMIRSKGEAGTGDVSAAVRHLRTIRGDITRLRSLDEDERFVAAKEVRAPYDVGREVGQTGNRPVDTDEAEAVAAAAEVAVVRHMGGEGGFVGSGILQSGVAGARVAAMLKPATHLEDPSVVAEVSRG